MARPIDLSRLRTLVADGAAQLVEVLPDEEYRWAHLPDAAHVPLGSIDEHVVSHFSADRPVVVYCNDSL